MIKIKVRKLTNDGKKVWEKDGVTSILPKVKTPFRFLYSDDFKLYEYQTGRVLKIFRRGKDEFTVINIITQNSYYEIEKMTLFKEE